MQIFTSMVAAYGPNQLYPTAIPGFDELWARGAGNQVSEQQLKELAERINSAFGGKDRSTTQSLVQMLRQMPLQDLLVLLAFMNPEIQRMLSEAMSQTAFNPQTGGGGGGGGGGGSRARASGGGRPSGGPAPASGPSNTNHGRLPAEGRVNGYVNGQARQIEVASVGNGESMRTDAAAAFKKMQAAAAKEGVNLTPGSGFRTMEEQEALYAKYKAGTGNLAAKPGHSNHQGGLSMDIDGVGGYNTKAYNWLKANAAKFGFENDVQGEYWHWTFKG